MSRPRLTVRMLDAWRLALAAFDLEEFGQAAVLTDEALRLSGWDRYEPGSRLRSDQIFYSPLIPRGWGYFARVDEERHLLVHEDAAQLVSDWSHLPHLMNSCEALDGGLIRLSEALTEVLLHTVTPPDDLSELMASPRP